MPGPKTIEEARALPEIYNILDGRLFMCIVGLDGDTICAFVDSDGRSKKVECVRRTIDGPDEWVKSLL